MPGEAAMTYAEIARWSSPSPLWQWPPHVRRLRQFPPHLRPNYAAPPASAAALPEGRGPWAIGADPVWQIASPAIAFYTPVRAASPAAMAPPPAMPPVGSPGIWLHMVLVGSLCAISTATGGQELEGYLPANLPIVEALPNTTVLSRPRPDYDPPGVRAGSFVMHAQGGESVGFDSDPRATPGQAGSAYFSTQGIASIASDWSRNSVAASVSVQDQRYLQLPHLSRTDDTVSLGGRYDVGTADHLVLSATHSDLHILPTGLDAVAGRQDTVPFQVNGGTASYLLNLSRLTLEPFATLNDYVFSASRISGVSQSNSYLDNATVTEGVTARYEFSPLHHAVLVVRGTQSNYSHQLSGVAKRDSSGVSVLGGLDYVADGLWRYRALVGYQERNYVSSTYKSQAAPIVEADVIWSPSRLTTVEATANRRIVDSTDPLTPSYTDTTLQLQVQHELQRNLLLSARVGYEQASYDSNGGQQTIYNGGVTATWLLNQNQNQKVSASFDHLKSSSRTRSSYTDDQVLLGFTVGI
ncbi:outer membrane beta-barrel protein [Acidisphaera sp. L21]|uniref:outer membrane beta-barrel protein n=1 Tax=Acidisphaera sp. L21 TaxID=1641851 RepID=UPI00131C4A2B|nr:outer membrane beta-barrel protein [Acidisphaera sp. L21]